MIKMKNRSDTVVGYKIPQTRTERELYPSQTIEVSEEEVKDLLFQKGGKALLREYLLIEQDVAEKLGLDLSPEFWLDRPEIEALLKSKDIRALKNCLIYGPTGLKDIVKQIAVNEEFSLSREQKRIINEVLGINLDSMIKNAQDAKIETPAVEPTSDRDYSFLKEKNYNVVEDKKEKESPKIKNEYEIL